MADELRAQNDELKKQLEVAWKYSTLQGESAAVAEENHDRVVEALRKELEAAEHSAKLQRDSAETLRKELKAAKLVEDELFEQIGEMGKQLKAAWQYSRLQGEGALEHDHEVPN